MFRNLNQNYYAIELPHKEIEKIYFFCEKLEESHSKVAYRRIQNLFFLTKNDLIYLNDITVTASPISATTKKEKIIHLFCNNHVKFI